MRRLLVWTLLLAVASRASADVAVGEKPAIDWKMLAGKPIASRDLRGWIAVVLFWAGDDDWTIGNAERLHAMNEAYARRGVRLIGVALDRERKDALAAVKRAGFPWPQAHDGGGFGGPIAKAWGVSTAPRAFILSPEGEVLWRGHPSAIASGALDQAMERHPPRLSREVFAALAVEQIQEAVRLLKEDPQNQDYRPALRVLGQIAPDVLSDPKVRGAAKALLPLFEPRSERDRLSLDTYSQAFPAGSKALQAIRDAIKAAATQPALAGPSPAVAERRAALAETRMEAGDKHRAAGEHAKAYEAYQQVAKAYADTPSAGEAKERVAAYEADEKLMAQIKAAQAEDDATELLKLAESYEQAKREDPAVETYKKIVEKYPDTKAAGKAKAALAKR